MSIDRISGYVNTLGTIGAAGALARRAGVVAVAVTAIASGSASAQCVAGWGALSGANAEVRSLTVMQDGDFVIGGSFTLVGGVPAPNKIARYNVTTGTWSAPATGSTGNLVHALATHPDGKSIYAGGNYSSIGGVTINRIGRYNFSTQTWTDLGFGTNGGVVYAILPLSGGDVIVGGNFPRVAGISRPHMARYHPSTNTWSSVNSNMFSTGDEVAALAEAPDGTVAVAGPFLSASTLGASSRGVARYHPATNTWSTLGTGLNGGARAVAVMPDGDVVVGGDFTMAGGVPVSRIARFDVDTGTWSNMGGGIAGAFLFVASLTVLPDGDLVAGGSFTSMSGVAAARIARYHSATNTWSAFSLGANNDVSDLATLPTGNIIAGGFFTNVSSRVGHYSWGGTSASVQDHPADTTACELDAAMFSVSATGTGPFQYQWQHEFPSGTWNDLSNGPNGTFGTASGAYASTLTLTDLGLDAPGNYRCLVSNTCGQVTSNVAVLTVDPCTGCNTDYNQDGGGDTTDVIDLANDIAMGTESYPPNITDFNQDGGGDTTDVIDMANTIASGECP